MITKKRLDEAISDLVEYSSYAGNQGSGFIYHYTSPMTVENILLDAGPKLRFTKSECMNDISEGYYVDEIFRIAIKFLCDFGEITKKYRDFLSNIYTIAHQYFRDGIGDEPFKSVYQEMCVGNDYYLCCFSSNKDALSLWNYYIKNKAYEGFCIGFRANVIEKAKYRGEIYDIHICSVVYDKFYEKCEELIRKYSGMFRTANDSEKAMLAYIFCCFLEKHRMIVKNNSFYHEQEVRAILNIKSNGEIVEKYDWSKGFPRPYIEIDYDKSAFQDIVIGPLIEKEISKKMLEQFLASRKYPFSGRVHNSKAPIRF